MQIINTFASSLTIKERRNEKTIIIGNDGACFISH